jgi:integrase
MSRNGDTAFVRINGKRIYLGKYGSPEATENYARCIAEWAVGKGTPGQFVPPIGSLTIDALSVAFLDFVKKNKPGRYYEYRSGIRILVQLYPGMMVDSFTPKCLAALQYQFSQHIDINGKQYSRQYCNCLVKGIRAMFRWGVAQELVSPMTAEALRYVPSLYYGNTTAPESRPRTDVPDAVVDTTLPHLMPTLSAMVQVQRWALMRPNEVCRMRVGDVDRSRKDGVWIYRPAVHKGTWRGHSKSITLGEPEQVLMLPYLEERETESAVFSPKVTAAEKKAKSPKRQKRKKRSKANPKFNPRAPGDFYNSKSYARAIGRAIKKANRSLPDDQKIPHWTPYQLRHAAITELVYENDGNLEIARAVAGQSSINVTQGYNHADLDIAIEDTQKCQMAFSPIPLTRVDTRCYGENLKICEQIKGVL